jgi:hypothetical protein
MRHIITVTRRIAGALASNFSLHPHIPAIGTADPDMCIVGITPRILTSKDMTWPLRPCRLRICHRGHGLNASSASIMIGGHRSHREANPK